MKDEIIEQFDETKKTLESLEEDVALEYAIIKLIKHCNPVFTILNPNVIQPKILVSLAEINNISFFIFYIHKFINTNENRNAN